MKLNYKSFLLLGLLVLFCMWLVSCGVSDLLEQERLLRIEAENTSSFLIGMLFTGMAIALLTGVGLGTKARDESDRQREERGER